MMGCDSVWSVGAWLSAWMARPLLVARSIGSAHHSGTPRTLRTAVLLIPAWVVLGAVPDNGFMRPCAAVGDRSAWWDRRDRVVQASTTGEAVIETYLALSGVVCSALPHTVSQDLHANHEGKQPRSRQGDSS